MRNIESLLKKKNITMYQLANAIGESHPRTSYLVKTNNFSETYIMLKKSAEYLKCDIEDLIEFPKK
ncbi:MAG: helix-turn-helix transcriptional regulator [Flavobacteriaceae bacterium]